MTYPHVIPITLARGSILYAVKTAKDKVFILLTSDSND